MEIMTIHCNFALNGFFFNKGGVAQCCMQETLFRKTNWNDVKDLNEFYKTLDKFEEVRKALNEGIRHPACQSCWKDEDIYGSSMRTVNSTFNKGYRATSTDIKVVDLRLSNKCNLQCRMCNPSDSDQLANLSISLSNEGLLNPYKDMVIDKEVFDNELLLDLILNLPDLESLRFAGGEPFIMPEVEKFLYNLIKVGKLDISIEFITNCTSIKSDIMDLLKKFRNVNINCSIDGVDETFEYQRYPAKWKTVEKNFLCLYNNDTFKISIVPCVGILNYLSLDKFFNWVNQFPNAKVSYNEIYDPSFFNFRFIPQENRKLFYDRFSKIKLINADKKWKQFQESIMYENSIPSQTDCDKLYQYVTMWDRRNKNSFLDLYPWANYMIEQAIK